jgi:hypothetical protein
MRSSMKVFRPVSNEKVSLFRAIIMRIILTFSVLSAAFLTVSMFSCGSNGGGNDAGPNGQNPLESNLIGHSTVNSGNPLIGTWVSGEYSLTFKSDNTYAGDLNGDGIPEVWGHVMISGNVVIFSESAGNTSSSRQDGGQITSGTYTYGINGVALAFSPILDLCHDPQANVLCLSYQKEITRQHP